MKSLLLQFVAHRGRGAEIDRSLVVQETQIGANGRDRNFQPVMLGVARQIGVKRGHRRHPQLPGIGQTKRAQDSRVDDVEQIG